MVASSAVLIFALIAGSTYALPTTTGKLSSVVPSGTADIVATEPFPTATGPTCIQTRFPGDPQASVINAATQDDDSINKACDISTQKTTTINNGFLSVIYYGLNDQYFFNISHNANTVSRPIASPDLCPDTFKNIFSTCVVNQNFWGGWVMTDGTNRSITNFVYPANAIANGGAGSSVVSSGGSATGKPSSGAVKPSTGFVGNGPETQNPVSSTNGAGGTKSGGPLPTGPSTNAGQPSSTGKSHGSHGGASATRPFDSSAIPSGDQGTKSSGLPTTGEPPRTSNPSGPGHSEGQQPTSNNLPGSGNASGSKAASTNAQGPGTTRPQPPATQHPGASSQPAGSEHTGEPPATQHGTTRPSNPETSSPPSSIPLPPGGTVVHTTISGVPYSETFVPTTLSGYATLASTITSSTLDSHSSAMPVVIGPGGVGWAPLSKASGTVPELSPPTVLPTNPNAPHQTTTAPGQSGPAGVPSSGAATSKDAPNPTAIPTKTPAPGTTQGGGGPTGAALTTITTSYDPEASKVTSIGPEITGNTAIRTSDDHHGLGFYPFWKGGPHCFIICPPGIDNGGIILWGMDKPGIYPPPTPPPFPGINWPTITINDDLEPTATEEPDDEPTKPTNSKPDESAKSTAKPTEKSTAQSTAKTTSKPSSSSVQSSTRSSTHSGSYTVATQKYILAIPTVGTEELKQRNTWLAKFYHISGASGVTSSGSIVASTTGASSIVTTKGPIASSTRSPPTASVTLAPTSKVAQTSASVNPADCPNDGVRQNAPNCPKPSSATGFSCGLASNIGVATYTPATWCACQNPDNSYSTMSGDHPCAYTAPPATPIHPHVVTPAPTGIPPLSDCSLVITTMAGTIAPGPQTYCSCGEVIAGINTKTSDGMVYSICAGDPGPTVASSSLPPAKTTAPPKPKASEAIIIYREDSCSDIDCSSEGHIFEITPGQPVNPCKDDDVFGDSYTQSVANDDSDYPVNFGPFKAHNIDGLKYSGSNKHVGTLTGDIPGSPIQCIVPAAQATSCTDSHSIQADDMIPIVYCEW
ncbi:MAG: hypothetical protein Q9225_001900 [Loekoesia sp. 1 TL-2023]